MRLAPTSFLAQVRALAERAHRFVLRPQSQGILTGREIARQVKLGKVVIDPYRPEHVNPASYDVTLGETVKVYENVVSTYRDWKKVTGEMLHPIGGVLDMAKEQPTRELKMDPERGMVLMPGVGYLMHTKERVWTDSYVPVLDGKSSLGRLFVIVHATAGYIDPGFDGQVTHEVTVTHPVRVYPGVRIGQLRFHTLVGSLTSYADHNSAYKGVHAEGPVASRSFKQVEGLVKPFDPRFSD